MTVPKAVIEALGARSAMRPAPRPVSRAICRGDLRLIAPPYDSAGEHRLGLVLDVNTLLHFTEIALVHPYIDLATSMDGIVPGDRTGTSYAIVVQTDLRGVVWTSVQVSDLVGQLPDQDMEGISDLVESGQPGPPNGIRIGASLGGPQDRRWSFKASEGKALDDLTSDCSNEVIDGRSPWVLDRELLMPDLLAACGDLNSVLVELAHWLTTRDLRISVDDALELEEIGALDFDAWQRANLGLGLYEALLEVVQSALTDAASSRTRESTTKAVVAPYSDRRTHAEIVYVMGTLVGSAS